MVWLVPEGADCCTDGLAGEEGGKSTFVRHGQSKS